MKRQLVAVESFARKASPLAVANDVQSLFDSDPIDWDRTSGHWVALARCGASGAQAAMPGQPVRSFLDASVPTSWLPLGYQSTALYGAAHWHSAWSGFPVDNDDRGLRDAYRDLIRRSLNCPDAIVSFFAPGSLSVASLLQGLDLPNSGAVSRVHARPDRVPAEFDSLWCERQPLPPVARDATCGAFLISGCAAGSADVLWIDAQLLEPVESYAGQDATWRTADAGLAGLAEVIARQPRAAIFDASRLISFCPSRLERTLRRLDAMLSKHSRRWVVARCGDVGILLSPRPLPQTSEPSPLRLIQSYASWSLLEQFESSLTDLQQVLRNCAVEIATNHCDSVRRCWVAGTSLGIECGDRRRLDSLHQRLQQLGVRGQPNGENGIAFYFNLSARHDTCEVWLKCIQRALTDLPADDPPIEVETRDAPNHKSFHLRARRLRRTDQERGPLDGVDSATGFLSNRMRELGWDDADVILLTKDQLPRWETEIQRIQEEVYEPSRVTPIEKFRQLVALPNQISLLVVSGQQIVAKVFAGPLQHFALSERGVASDPWRDDRPILYVMDLTVTTAFRGQLGRLLKETLVLLAISQGYSAIHGRNRDRLAAPMWSINLSLGSYEIQHLLDDYPDDLPYRDCLYYRCPLQWPRHRSLYAASALPFDGPEIDEEHLMRALPYLANRCLPHAEPSVIETWTSWIRQRLCGNHPCTVVPAGDWSRLAISLSQASASGRRTRGDSSPLIGWIRPGVPPSSAAEEAFLETHFFDVGGGGVQFGAAARATTVSAAIAQLQQRRGERPIVWLESMPAATMTRLGDSSILQLLQACQAMDLSVIMLESAAASFRWAEPSSTTWKTLARYLAATVVACGRHAALAFVNPQRLEHYTGDPMLGTPDAFEVLALMCEWNCQQANADRADAVRQFDESFLRWLDSRQIEDRRIERGAGWFRGVLPEQSEDQLFGTAADGRRLVNAGYRQMLQWMAFQDALAAKNERAT